ncbi:MAG: hypothetical protein ACXABY_14180, partial [Candidatus Thorarchaeota archaeon]
ATGWTAPTTLGEALEMKQQSQNAYHYGPWMLYFATGWDRYLDDDYSSSYPGVTLRSRLKLVDGFLDVRTLDYLDSYDFVMVEFNPEVIRMVIGMDVTALEWDTSGGLQKNFKVMTIMVPQLRADIAGNTGIVYGSV